MARMASSDRSPRPSKACPNTLNSGSSDPDTDTGDDPAVAQEIEGAQPFHQFQWVVVGEDGHVGQQAHPCGLGGEETQRGERVPVAAAPHGGGRGRDGDVLGAGHPVVAQGLGLLHHVDHVADAGRDLPFRRVEPRVHVQDRGHDAELECHGPHGSAGHRIGAAHLRLPAGITVQRYALRR